jgi:hypothetical protein
MGPGGKVKRQKSKYDTQSVRTIAISPPSLKLRRARPR